MALDWQTVQTTTNLFEPLLKAKRPGIVSDFDGTLSKIVFDPDIAVLTPRSRTALQILTQHTALVALVSGRKVRDLKARAGLDGVVYVGNHGLERWQDGAVVVPPDVVRYYLMLEQVAKVIQEMTTSDLPGVQVEDKHETISIHYRRAENPERASAILQPVLEKLGLEYGLRLYSGRMVYELRPPLEINKGTIFSDLVRSYRLDAAIYIGDDTTDADALLAARKLRSAGLCYALAMGVESDSTPPAVRETADVLVPGDTGVEVVLEWLAETFSALSESAS